MYRNLGKVGKGKQEIHLLVASVSLEGILYGVYAAFVKKLSLTYYTPNVCW
jgi:hypothetical protein